MLVFAVLLLIFGVGFYLIGMTSHPRRDQFTVAGATLAFFGAIIGLIKLLILVF